MNTRNTIIALNTAGINPDIRGPVTSQGFNLIGNNSGATITPTTGDQIGTAANPIDPLLGPLQNNGGPTLTHALLSGSPAIEVGNSGGSGIDQRGFARPVDSPSIANASGGDGSDIGAYEVQADQLPGCNTVNLVVNNSSDSGSGSLRDVIANACAGSTITFAPGISSPITLTSGELAINKAPTINGPGANLLTVRRDSAAPSFRIFDINPATTPAYYNVSLAGLTISNGNIAIRSGGAGIRNNANLTLTGCVISGNVSNMVATFPSKGGGLVNDSSDAVVSLTNSTISGNSATGNNSLGGGISNSGIVNLTNSTISGNSAVGGGGIYNVATVNLFNSTISGNLASSNGGGLSGGGNINAKNTLIALNTAGAGPDVNGALTSQGFNLIGNSSGATITPAQFTDQIGTAGSPLDPLLGPLTNNGGPTPTQALLTNSPAIDKGHASGSVTDQRGFARPIELPGIPNATGGDGSDIGAFEVQASTLRIDSVSPVAGRVTGGQQIILTGAFAGLSSVTIGGNAATWTPTNGTSQITITTPSHAVGAVNIDLLPASGGAYSKPNAFAYLPTIFTDDTLTVGVTTAKAQHILELRQAVDVLRVVAGLAPAPWTDPTLLLASTVIKAVHITELRFYLDQAAGAGTYADPALSSGVPIKRVHIEELRQRIRAIAG